MLQYRTAVVVGAETAIQALYYRNTPAVGYEHSFILKIGSGHQLMYIMLSEGWSIHPNKNTLFVITSQPYNRVHFVSHHCPLPLLIWLAFSRKLISLATFNTCHAGSEVCIIRFNLHVNFHSLPDWSISPYGYMVYLHFQIQTIDHTFIHI